MLRPEIIEKIKRDREKRDRSSAQIPLYVPEIQRPEDEERQDDKQDSVVVIELA